MAITVVGPPLAGVRGTIGGITYSENKAGTYAKLWAPPSNPRTSPQAQARTILARMGGGWLSLSQGQRDGWDAFAAAPAQEQTNELGESYYLSGVQWFGKVNAIYLRAGGDYQRDAPIAGYPDAPDIDAFRVCVSGSESDQCTGGTASASTAHASYPASNAFDDNTATWWQPPSGTTTGWIQYTFAAARNIKHYRQFFAAWADTYQARDWTFQVYTGGAWVTLQTITGEANTPVGWHYYYVVNPYTETQYRLNITANNGHPTVLLVLELEFRLGEVGESCLCYDEMTWEDPTNTTAYAMVAMTNSPVRTVQYPGFHIALLDFQIPHRGSSIQTALESYYGTVLANRAWFARIQRISIEGLRSPITAMTTTTIGGS